MALSSWTWSYSPHSGRWLFGACLVDTVFYSFHSWVWLFDAVVVDTVYFSFHIHSGWWLFGATLVHTVLFSFHSWWLALWRSCNGHSPPELSQWVVALVPIYKLTSSQLHNFSCISFEIPTIPEPVCAGSWVWHTASQRPVCRRGYSGTSHPTRTKRLTPLLRFTTLQFHIPDAEPMFTFHILL